MAAGSEAQNERAVRRRGGPRHRDLDQLGRCGRHAHPRTRRPQPPPPFVQRSCAHAEMSGELRHAQPTARLVGKRCRVPGRQSRAACRPRTAIELEHAARIALPRRRSIGCLDERRTLTIDWSRAQCATSQARIAQIRRSSCARQTRFHAPRTLWSRRPSGAVQARRRRHLAGLRALEPQLVEPPASLIGRRAVAPVRGVANSRVHFSRARSLLADVLVRIRTQPASQLAELLPATWRTVPSGSSDATFTS